MGVYAVCAGPLTGVGGVSGTFFPGPQLHFSKN